MHNVIRQTVSHIDNSISKKIVHIISCAIFCNLKSLPLVVRVGASARLVIIAICG